MPLTMISQGLVFKFAWKLFFSLSPALSFGTREPKALYMRSTHPATELRP